MLGTRPTELRLTLAPQHRFEAIDVTKRIAQEAGDILRRHERALYCSFHTTAGYLDQSLSLRLGNNQDHLSQFVGTFRELFPEGAEYHHDRMERARPCVASAVPPSSRTTTSASSRAARCASPSRSTRSIR